MEHIWEIAITIISSGICGVTILIFKTATKGFGEIKRNTKLVAMKHDALMYALDQHLQNGIRNVYSQKLAELMDEHGFIYKL